jgi:predicted MFS family arabinose efflux permease
MVPALAGPVNDDAVTVVIVLGAWIGGRLLAAWVEKRR